MHAVLIERGDLGGAGERRADRLDEDRPVLERRGHAKHRTAVRRGSGHHVELDDDLLVRARVGCHAEEKT